MTNYKMKNKKGAMSWKLMTIILTIVSFMLISYAYYQAAQSADEKKIETICKSTVALTAKNAISIDGLLIPKLELMSKPLCKTIDINLDNSKKEEEIKRKIADKMAKCWEMFGEGRYEKLLKGEDDVFSKFQTMLGIPGKNGCFVCYVVTLDNGEVDISASNFAKFLRTKQHPVIKKTYLNYFQSYGGPGSVVILPEKIESGKAYGIAFMSINRKPNTGVTTAFNYLRSTIIGEENVPAENIDVYIDHDHFTSTIILDDYQSAQTNCYEGEI
jgi:hypothetical protein